jgi:hypothetical protein
MDYRLSTIDYRTDTESIPVKKPSTADFTRPIVAALASLAIAALAAQAPPSIDTRAYLDEVRYLASDELQGRGNGTPGLDKAADFIAARFKEAGLEPGGTAGYFQMFDIVTGLQVGGGNSLSLAGPGGSHAFQLGEDYYPMSVVSSPAQKAARAAQPVTSPRATSQPPSRTPGQEDGRPLPVAFAGYGISAPGLEYDDYAGVDVSGKVVLIFTHEPQENDATSRFDGKANTVHAAPMTKAMVARSHGARLLLVVEDMAHATDGANYHGFMQDPQADEYGIPVLRVSRDEVRHVLGASLDLAEVARQIDSDVKPRSRLLDGVAATFAEDFAKIRRPVRNVVAVLGGSDPVRASEAIVVGAHYDHLGLGGRHSMAPGATGQIHHGADDNASGTAAVLEIARAAAADRAEFPRSVVFVAFAGEELGLLGSAYYVEHPAFPLDRTVAMINLDMVGRPNGRVLVSGLDTAPDLDADLKAADQGSALQVRSFREGASVGSSDDTSFILRKIPSIAFFSGFHADYHRPSDTSDKIDATGAAEVTRIAFGLARHIAERTARVAFVPPKAPAQGSPAATGGGGYGAYFGSVPDFGESDEGVKFADVREGSPAAKAGLQRGDVLVSWEGKPIKTLYDFTFALRSKRPGDKVEVVVMRNGKPITATVELGNRQ